MAISRKLRFYDEVTQQSLLYCIAPFNKMKDKINVGLLLQFQSKAAQIFLGWNLEINCSKYHFSLPQD
jgi:hypothetical protein